MRRIVQRTVIAGAVALALAAAVAAQDSTHNGPVPMQTSINEMMVMGVDYAAHWIWDAQEAAPKTDEDWFRMRVHATQLVVLGSAMTLGGKGVADDGWVHSPKWAQHAQEMIDSAAASLKAIDSRNAVALNASGGRLAASCEGCHKEFKPDLPTEGVLHRDVHREGREAF